MQQAQQQQRIDGLLQGFATTTLLEAARLASEGDDESLDEAVGLLGDYMDYRARGGIAPRVGQLDGDTFAHLVGWEIDAALTKLGRVQMWEVAQ